ncbi:MAG: ABC transporter permease [Actinomycetota bacterium]|jgi:peptide/nickel transport system permease protein|nr:ABC transporter permease [Actinomycetota bacterium]
MGMVRFLVRRILSGIVVLWVVATLSFMLFFVAVPEGVVARNLAGRAATPAVLAEVMRNLGLNRPWYVQYGHYMDNLIHGNLGYSYYTQQPVIDIIKLGFPATLSVVVGGVILWLVVGLGVGILSATRARSLFDRVATVGVLAGVSAPVFVVGEILIVVVYVQLNNAGIHFIQTGYTPISQSFTGWLGTMILPWVTLATVQAAIYTRLSRGSLLDTLGEDYIRTARAKGLSERRVLYRHAVRSALTPVVSQLGIDVGALLGGVIVVEQVFGLQGIGQETVQAITNGDGQLVLGFIILAALFVVVANLVVDIAYALLDPRVRIH